MNTSDSEAEEFIVRQLLNHANIKPKDLADILSVTEQHASRLLRASRESGVLEIRSSNSRGRGVFHTRGPGFDDALERHGLA